MKNFVIILALSFSLNLRSEYNKNYQELVGIVEGINEKKNLATIKIPSGSRLKVNLSDIKKYNHPIKVGDPVKFYQENPFRK